MNIQNVEALDDALGVLIEKCAETQTLLRKVRGIQSEGDTALLPLAAKTVWATRIGNKAAAIQAAFTAAKDIFVAP